MRRKAFYDLAATVGLLASLIGALVQFAMRQNQPLGRNWFLMGVGAWVLFQCWRFDKRNRRRWLEDMAEFESNDEQ